MMRKMFRRAEAARATGDAGQMSIAVIVLFFLGMMMTIFWIGLPIGQATDQKAGSQAAADAAALAAAQDIRAQLPNWIQDEVQGVDSDDLDDLFDGLKGRFGLAAAAHYADLNGATLTRYRYDHASDEIDVTVKSRASASESNNQHSFSSAKAKLGLDLGNCEVVDDDPSAGGGVLPPDGPGGGGIVLPPDDDPADDDAPIGTELRCGSLVLHFTVSADQGVTLDDDLNDLADEFDIRLSQ